MRYLAIALALCLTACEGQYDPNHEYRKHDHVRVHNGYYENCEGYIVEPVWSGDKIDREGKVHPSIFAGYDVDIKCSQATGIRSFTPDFMRPIEEKHNEKIISLIIYLALKHSIFCIF